LGSVGRRLRCNVAQFRDADLAVARESERGGLELRLLREKEDERAHAGVGRWDVEIEDGTDVGGDLAVV